MRRRGFTMIELVVALAVGAVLSYAAFETLHVLVWGGRGGRSGSMKGATRRSARAVQEAFVLEALLQDVRSAAAVEEVAPGSYRIRRWEEGEQGLEEREILWEQVDAETLVRTDPEGRTRRFSFEGLADEDTGVLQLRLEPVNDVLFEP